MAIRSATSLGTGIVLTSNGEILTNNHVINGATSVSVTDIGNGKTYKATVVGYDESQDIAVLQLSGASGLTTASTGDSSTVSVGDSVVALGNAGGVGGTPAVAPGSVTALNQSITASDESSGSSEQLTGLIETNADIQAGDSGGPLVNSHGQVIGDGHRGLDQLPVRRVRERRLRRRLGGSAPSGSGSSGSGSSGSSNSGGSTTQGYAIPINTALTIAKADRGGPGVLDGAHRRDRVHRRADRRSQQGFHDHQGVAIAGAQSGTPAANAGLGQGDVMTALDGKSVSTGTDIQEILVGHHPGDKVSVAWTDTSGQSHTATLTLGTGPAA